MAKQMADRRKIAVVLLVAAVVVAVGGISSYAAKYAHKETGEGNATSEEFYFTSDLLTSDGSKRYELPVGTTSVTFELRNYADDLRSTAQSDIAYSCSVTKDDGTSAGNLTNGSGSIAKGSQQKKAVTVTGLSAGTYTVTATSTSPYAQTLSAKFVIADADTGLSTRVEDSSGDAYATLIVSTKEYEGNITVSWPSGVIADQTQDEFKDTSGSAGGSITKRVEKYSSYSFRFFKTDASKNYSDKGTEAGTITATK